MSVFGAMTTAVGGLTAQSRSLGHISDNIANSQTIGYKRVETSFQNLVTISNSTVHAPGGVRAKPSYTNAIQGNISQTQNATNLAISGSGFFQASRGEEVGGRVNFQSQTFFTRAGDFSLDKNGYLRNGAGLYLNGWGLRSGTNTVERGTPAPIRVQQLIDNPTATSNISLSANLPLSPDPSTPLPTSEISIIDRNGESRTVNLNWRKQGTNLWRLSVDAPGSIIQPTSGTLPGQPQSFGTPVQLIQNTTPQRQVSALELAVADAATGPEDGKVYSVTINSQTFSYIAQNYDTTESVMGALVNQINSSGNYSDYTFQILDPAGGTINSPVRMVVTGPRSGNPFTLNVSTTANAASGTFTAFQAPTAAPTAEVQSNTIPNAAPAVGDTYTLNINGTDFTYTAVDGDTAGTAATRLANRVNEAFAGNPAFAGYSMEIVEVGGPPPDYQMTVTGPNDGRTFTMSLDINGGGATAATVDVAGVPDTTESVDAPGTTLESLGIRLATAVPGARQQVFVPLSGITGDVEDIFNIPFSETSENISYSTDGTEQNLETVATRLAALVNSNANVQYTAEVSGAGLILTRKTFTNPTVNNAGIGDLDTVDGETPAHVEVRFGEGGVLSSLNATNVGTGNAQVSATQGEGDEAYVTFTVDFGNGEQEIRLNLGQFSSSVNGLTQFAGENIETFNLTQDGFTRGAFRDLSILASGEVVANYDNGRTRVLAQIPIFQVSNPEGLQKVDGNAYVSTTESGAIRANAAGENGAGALIVSSIEGSNVDIADEFTKLIVTQRAYSANTRVVTTANDMLVEVLNLTR